MTSVSEAELDRLFELGHISHANESAFFKQLIRANVYVHAPISDDSKHVRLVQFRHPEGFSAIPFFTSKSKAIRASSAAVRILQLPCADLFSSTKGATLMVNPNDGGAVLYPEEIATLLELGEIHPLEKISIGGGSMDIRIAENPPRQVVDALIASVGLAPFIQQVYLLDWRTEGEPMRPSSLLIYLGCEEGSSERAARFVVALIQGLNLDLNRVVEVSTFVAAGPRPEFLDQIGAQPLQLQRIVARL